MPFPAFVTLLGMGTVFVGLVCIVFICNIMSGVVKLFVKSDASKPEAKTAPVQASQPKTAIANKQEFIAAVSAAIAEDMGTDISGIRILSVKQL